MVAILPRERVAEGSEATTSRDSRLLDARVAEMINRHACVGFALGVVRNGRLEFLKTHGLADVQSGRPFAENTVVRIASITKTFTAVAVMQLHERGLIDLDAPANEYLRAYRLVSARASFQPATVRHLLTHTSGLPQVARPLRALMNVPAGGALYDSGESYAASERMPSLAEYYGRALRVVAEPGTRFTYLDHGFATLGQVVEDVTGMPLARYFHEHIFEPLGMTDSDLVLTERLASRRATGYTLGARGLRPITDRQWVTAGASNIYSTPADMGRYVATLLGGGGNEQGRVLRPESVATMFAAQYQTDPRIPGMGLGFWRGDFGGHLVADAPGVLPGFNSQLWLAPDDGIGVMAFTNGSPGALTWLMLEVGALLRELLGVPPDVIRRDVAQQPERWSDLVGWYPVSARLTDNQARGMAGLGAEVFVRRGTLMVRALTPIPAVYRGLVLHPDDAGDPDAFRIDLSRFGLGTARIVFSRTPDGDIAAMHSDMVPITLRKQPSNQNPRRWARRAAPALAGLAMAGVVRRRRHRVRAASS